jgi:hypothetical protein
MRQHILTILLRVIAVATSGAIFLVSLIHQYPLVEVAASLLTGLQVFFLSTAVADMLEKAKQANHVRNIWVVVFTVFLVAFYSFTRYFQ